MVPSGSSLDTIWGNRVVLGVILTFNKEDIADTHYYNQAFKATITTRAEQYFHSTYI